MRKIISTILMLFLIIGIFNFGTIINADSEFAGGDGTSANPFKISNAEQLLSINNNPSAEFIITNDIDLSGITSGISFSGVIDGANYSLSNLTGISGLFSNSSGTIKNINLVNVNITCEKLSYGYDSAYTYIGAIANINSGTISNCSITGSIKASSEGGSISVYAAGVTGLNKGTISNCVNNANVSVKGKGRYNVADAAGIACVNENGQISDCINNGYISAESSSYYYATIAGGIVAYDQSKNDWYITNCKNNGRLSAIGTDAYTDDIIPYPSNYCHIVHDNEPPTSTPTPIQTFEQPYIISEIKYPEVKVLLNDQELSFDQPPIIRDGRTLVPLRAITENMGAKVDWNNDTQTITLQRNSTNISLQIGNTAAQIGDSTYYLDVAPIIENGRTLVPVRFIAESFNAYVYWDEKNYTVKINDGIGAYNISRVKAYTSEFDNSDFTKIENSDMEDFEKAQAMQQLLNEIHIDERWKYLGLSNNNMYVANQFKKYLEGNFAAWSAVGLSKFTFGGDLLDYATINTPERDRYKDMLRKYIEDTSEDLKLRLRKELAINNIEQFLNKIYANGLSTQYNNLVNELSEKLVNLHNNIDITYKELVGVQK